MYENNYPNTYHYEQPVNNGSDKPKKSGSGFGKKAALGICCGLLFGVFAGLGFEAVTTASDFVKEKTQVETSAEPETKEISQTNAEETATK